MRNNMEHYLNYISNNFFYILTAWFIGIPIFLFAALVRGSIWIIFNKEPFGFFSEVFDDLKRIKIKDIIYFLMIYTIFIFGILLPYKNKIFIISGFFIKYIPNL